LTHRRLWYVLRLWWSFERGKTDKRLILYNKMKTKIVLIFVFSISVSGCGTLGTWLNYGSYTKCIESCEKQFETDPFKRKCTDDCYSKFNWDQSPLLDHVKNLEKPKSQQEDMEQKFPLLKQDNISGQ
jgi:hypothetical protein